MKWTTTTNGLKVPTPKQFNFAQIQNKAGLYSWPKSNAYLFVSNGQGEVIIIYPDFKSTKPFAVAITETWGDAYFYEFKDEVTLTFRP